MEPVNTLLHLEVEDSEGKIIQKIVTIDPDDFSIDEANLDGELCRAGTLLCYYGDLVAELEAKSSNLKSRLDEVRSIQAIVIRASYVQKNTKLTENMLDEIIISIEDHRDARVKLINAQKEASKAANLFKAQFQKVECLKALAYRQRKMESGF